jgi:hypothetical protein
VNVITKSGTNEFHGTAFEFFRNTALNANEFFRNATVGTPGNDGSKLVLNQNQYGGVFGGPIKKDKLFFFVSYQETNQKNGISGFGYSVVTLPPIPAGNRGTCPVGWTALSQCDAAAQAFVPALGAAVCPANNPTNAFDKIKTTGSINVACNGSNINPVAVKMLQLKLDNGNYLVPGSGTGNYDVASFTDPARYHNHQGMGNWDYVINSRHTLSGRYYYETDPTTAPFAARGTSTTASQVLPGNPVFSQKTNHAAVLRLTSTLSNSLINEARISYQRTISTAGNLTTFRNSQVGITSLDPANDYLNNFPITGLFISSGANPTYGNALRDNQFEWADQISWARGKHTFRTGFEAERVRADDVTAGGGIASVTFPSFPDFLIGRGACPAGTFGTAAGQCNANNPGSSNGSQSSNIRTFAGTANASFDTKGRVVILNAFVQDDIKLTSRLTVNLGVRWEYDGFPVEQYGHTSNIWPGLVNTVPLPGSGCVINGQVFGAGATGTGCSLAGFMVPSNFQGSVPPGVYKSPLPYLAQSRAPLNDFAPRIGFAWQPTSSNRLVIRGGGGYFYDTLNGVDMLNYPMRNTPGQAVLTLVPEASLAQPWTLPAAVPGPAGTYGFTPRWANLTTGKTSDIGGTTLAPDQTIPLTYTWTLNTQYEFLRNWVLELGYVGTHGIRQPVAGGGGSPGGGSLPFNSAVLASPASPALSGAITNTVSNANLRVPYLGFATTITERGGNMSSYRYNGLQATVRKQMSHGVQFQASYSWNRAFATDVYGINAPPYSIIQSGASTVYHPHRLILNYTWDLPFGRPAGMLGKVVEGWSLSGVTTLQNGTPLTIFDSGGGTVFYGRAATGIAPAQFCPGKTAADIVNPGRVEDRLNNYFNAGVFCPVPVLGADGVATGYGNSAQGYLGLSPGQQNWDISIAKSTRVGGLREGATLLFRAEFFNAFNHPMFNIPQVLIGANNTALDVNSANFGRITQTSVNPRLIQLALKYSF